MNKSQKLRVCLEAPQFIYDTKHKIVLLWSAKAACTFATKWIFNHMGILEIALEHNSWIHFYRDNVLHKSKEHFLSLERAINDKDNKIVKIVRDPYTRAVSSYLHVVRRLSDKFNDNHILDKRIGYFLNREICTSNTFTFREFVVFLENIDVRKCDIHYRIQSHPLESMNILQLTHLIRLENLENGIKQFEKQHGFDSDFSKVMGSFHNTTRNITGKFWADHKFSFANGQRIYAPNSNEFYDEDLSERIFAIYQEDFERYHYPRTPISSSEKLDVDQSSDMSLKRPALRVKQNICSTEKLHEAARKHFENRRLTEAIHTLRECILLSPDDASAHNELAFIYLEEGKKDKAIEHYEMAVRFEPHNSIYLKKLANLYYATGRIRQATELYVKLLAANPSDREVLQILGDLCASQGEMDNARFFYGKVLELESWDGTAAKGLKSIKREQDS